MMDSLEIPGSATLPINNGSGNSDIIYNGGSDSALGNITISGGSTPSNVKWNNPLNIRRSSEAWQGKVASPTQKAFEEFIGLDYGTRAAVKNLITYNKRGWNTVNLVVSHWAPPSENNTNVYIKNVSDWIGVNKDAKLDLMDKYTMAALVAAMSRQEQGASKQLSQNYVVGVIEKFNLL